MDLATRIDRLESIEAIKKLKHVYMNWCDLGYPPDKLGYYRGGMQVWAVLGFSIEETGS